MLTKWFVLFGGVALGYAITVYSRKCAEMFGQSAWAEHKFGPGGTLTMWKMFGMGIAFLSLLYFTGDLACVRKGFEGFFSGMRT